MTEGAWAALLSLGGVAGLVAVVKVWMAKIKESGYQSGLEDAAAKLEAEQRALDDRRRQRRASAAQKLRARLVEINAQSNRMQNAGTASEQLDALVDELENEPWPPSS